MKQVFLSGKGQVAVLDSPLPGKLKNSVLIRNAFSLISTGTEGASVAKHGQLLGLVEKVWNSKDRINQVWNFAKRYGVKRTWDIVHDKLESYSMLGYSAAGTVVETYGDSLPFSTGHPVAAMGAGFALHAEYIAVPKNLIVPIPKNVPFDEATFGAIACIALQGIRRLELTPGERIGVLGLGLIGQVCIRLLRAMGYEAYGTDIVDKRIEKARNALGVHAWNSATDDSIRIVMDATGGRGLDGVVICAATKSNEPLNLAFDLCRHKGRVSVVGDIGLSIQREKMYQKELDLRMSTSYGPGRYDQDYEIEGKDYPFGYVRWTEQRNLEYFLHLLATGNLRIRDLISEKYPITNAVEAYGKIKNGGADLFGVLFDYGPIPNDVTAAAGASRTIVSGAPFTATLRRIPQGEQINLGLIGVGGYAKAIHIPNLKTLSQHFRIHGIASRTSGSATIVQKSTGARVATCDYRTLLDDTDIDAVIVSTRHATHAKIVIDALDAGKHVFVEKPMTTSISDGKEIVRRSNERKLVVRVGFNRRFSPFLTAMKAAVGERGTRMFFCRVNIGRLENDWSNTVEEGGRLLGEGVHFFDLCNWFLGQEPLSLSAAFAGKAEVTNPNSMITIQYPDCSTAHVIYSALGNGAMGKEYFEAFGNGKCAISNDYETAKSFGTKSGSTDRLKRGDKGQLAELEEFAAALKGNKYPIEGADSRAGLLATWMAHAAYESALTGQPADLEL